MHIGIVALLHESNTFASQPTTLERFREDLLIEGESLREALADSHHEVGGFFAGLDEAGKASPVTAVPLFACRATPGGIITADAFATIVGRMLSIVGAAASLDGILVAPHGAAVSDSHRDADGYWLARLRSLVGDSVSIVGTLDAHANLSPQMVESCDALIAYRTNPHLDQRERGQDAARLLVSTIRGEVRPTMAATYPPLAINIERQCTSEPHLRSLYALADQQLRDRAVLSNSVLLGFPYADVPEMGASAIVVADNDPDLAARRARDLGTHMWEHRQSMQGILTRVDEALQQCENKARPPVCLLDMGDNVGGGSSADGTWLVRELHRRRIGPAFACLYDPESVASCDAAGVGAPLLIRAGGKSDDLHGQPLELQVRVESLHDGKFHEDRPRHGGIVHFDQGRTAIVTAAEGELTLMLTSRRMVPFSLRQLTSFGIDPVGFRILVAKGVNAPLAAYAEACETFIRVNTPGSTCADLSRMRFTARRRPMYPFEDQMAWDA
jgi:microcystin degradation protein MlrC